MGGKPKGLPKSGGRRVGSKNKKTRLLEMKVTDSGLTPLDYMLTVLRSEDAEPAARMDAAKAAAPYVHPRLSAIENRAPTDPAGPVSVVEPVVVDARRAES